MLPTPAPSPIYIQMVGGGSSFWDSPLFIALLTLAGVIAGALLSFLANWLTETRKAKAELRTKFAEQVLDIAGGLSNEASGIAYLALQFSAHLDLPDASSPDEIDRIRLELDSKMEALRRDPDTAMLQLIAPAKIRNAAKSLLHYCGLVSHAVDYEHTEEWLPELWKAQKIFDTEVRLFINTEK